MDLPALLDDNNKNSSVPIDDLSITFSSPVVINSSLGEAPSLPTLILAVLPPLLYVA